MRAAFSYYIHRPSTAAGKSSPAFPIGHRRLSRPGFSWMEVRPAAQQSIVPLAAIRGPLTFVQSYRGLCSSSFERSFRVGPLPGMAECSCADPPPQAAEAPKGQPWLSGGRHSSRHAMLAATRRCPRRPSWGFSVARPWTVGGRWSSGGRAQTLPPSRRIAGKRVPAESRRGPAVAAAKVRASSVCRTGTEAAPGPPTGHPAQAEAVEGPGGRRPHYRARRALCRN